MRIRRSRSGLTSAMMPRPHTEIPGPVGWMPLQLWHLLVQRSHACATVLGTRSRCHGSTTVVAQSGSSPTIDRTLSRVALPSGSRSTS